MFVEDVDIAMFTNQQVVSSVAEACPSAWILVWLAWP
jgi:hypothetical protein